MLMTLKFVGTTTSRRNSLNFCTRTPSISTSAVRRIRPNRPTRTLRANRSLMISIVGMRPRTMRSWLARSKERTAPGAAAGSSRVALSPVMPCSRASTSAWEST